MWPRTLSLSGPFPSVLRLDERALGGEVQHQAPAYTPGLEATVCVSSLVGGENVGDAQRQYALLDLPGQLVEQDRVGCEGGR